MPPGEFFAFSACISPAPGRIVNVSETMARFVAGLDLDTIPARAIEVAKGGLVDAIGTAIAGTNTEPARILTRWARTEGGKPVCGVIGAGFKTSPAIAARANGTIGHAHDFDPPQPLLPVLLALGESERSTGRAVLEAYVAGVEVQSKLQGGITEKHSALGWHSNPIFGTFAATASAARLLGLDAHQTQMAFGIAASEASGVRGNIGTMAKPLHAGIAAANGILAATLARDGMSGAPDGLGGEFGVLRLVATPGEYDEHRIAGTFGDPWNLVDKEIRIKPYPCCRWAHRPLDAVLALVRENDVRPDQVESIECEVGAQVSEVMTYKIAGTELESKFCLPYCLAVAVIDRKAGLAQFTETRVRDSSVHALALRVKVEHPGGLSEYVTGALLPCVVRLRMKSGKVLEQSAGPALGDREKPMTFEGIVGKYRDCVEGRLSADDAQRVLALVKGIESLTDVSELADILTNRVLPQALP